MFHYVALALFLSSLIDEIERNMVVCTIDVNLSELEYLAAHLEPRECRRLVAALHYHSYELPESLVEAERRLDPDIPCLRQLLHWNDASSEGRGETHELLERRLRQLGRRQLADWLGRTTFRELGKDLLRSVDEPFPVPPTEEPDVATTTTMTVETNSYPTTTEATADLEDDEDIWRTIEMIVMVLFALLLFTLLVVIGALVIDKFARCRNEPDEKMRNADGSDETELLSE